MTDKTPVEELIGWKRSHDPWADANGLPFDGWLNGSGSHVARAEVDDLAAWLHERYRFIDLNWDRHHWTEEDYDDDDCLVSSVEHSTICLRLSHYGATDGDPFFVFTDSTIRDALIAAVRHVHKEEQ